MKNVFIGAFLLVTLCAGATAHADPLAHEFAGAADAFQDAGKHHEPSDDDGLLDDSPRWVWDNDGTTVAGSRLKCTNDYGGKVLSDSNCPGHKPEPHSVCCKYSGN